MTGTGPQDDDSAGGTAPCFMGDLDAQGMPVDLVQARDVARWRKVERERLIAERMAMSQVLRSQYTTAIARALDARISSPDAVIVSTYWPIRGEPDLRPWMRAAHDRGVRIALPVALELGRPMVFREWRPDAPLTGGLWKIPYPADGVEVLPTIVIAPLVGFDAACYRLGCGGGFFDRTLAALPSKPTIIGVGYPEMRIKTIYPQSFDVPMDFIIAGDALVSRRTA